MHRVKLDNGISVLYSSDAGGHVVIQYPDGSQVRTTWAQLSLIESLIEHLRQAYECLLSRASIDPATPVDTLMSIDDLLFSLRPHSIPNRPVHPTDCLDAPLPH